MEQDYESKFEEMKKYIPFLERMIKRLEGNTTTSGNPRQAQLAKIRSLRDLLLDKKKRMKMENLLKCEQVLVNLYAKVEHKDSFPELKDDIDTSLGTQNEELNLVRNKLKNVVLHLKDQETLPEIARANTSEEACTVGSKEPALFQRRPNKTSTSPPRVSLNNTKTSPSPSSNRTYSRVLISPEPDSNWSQEKSCDKPLFSRRSPRRTPKKSPRSRLPSPHNKKERKKSVSQSQDSNEPKDLNITLKVPEESLSSLNTKDIVSRIINCNDKDVDIDTLRGLRTQILSELKQTGAKDDISDLILQSYKNKKKIRKKEEIEEGELSDSESEVIESIYGSLVKVDKDQNNSNSTRKSDSKDDESRKIQICLVINPDKDKESEPDRSNASKNVVVDKTDFESFKDSKNNVQNKDIKCDAFSLNDVQEGSSSAFDSTKTVKNKESLLSNAHSEPESSKVGDESKNVLSTESKTLDPIKPKSYKPCIIAEQSKKIRTPDDETNFKIEEIEPVVNENSKRQEKVEIPLLDPEATAKQEVVHEIDILQALKKEILSEKISLDDPETVTPPLHQPKVTKVANMHRMITKKRISIEKYKEKATATSKPCLFPNQTKNISLNDELMKKQSIKLTEKEYERFNLSNKLSFDESSEDEDVGKRSPTIEDVYGDLAPQSPDHEDFADTGIKPPVIIPVDPVKSIVVPSTADVDMRLPPAFSPSISASKSDFKNDAKSSNYEKKFDVSNSEPEVNSNEKRVPLGDPRVRRESNHSSVDTSILGSVDRSPRPLVNFPPNVTSSMMPNVMPSPNPNQISCLTQNSNIIANPNTNSGVYQMTPIRQNFENDDYLQKTHVYSSTFSIANNNDVGNNDGHNRDAFSRPRNNFEHDRKDMAHVNKDFRKPLLGDKPSPLFHRLECPLTPIHPFGMADCPPTPTHSFGLLETPMTPIPSFGRCDAPMTPVHPFGLDCPPTPNHPFGGRTETLMTPTHPFGMADFSQNQSASQVPTPRYTSFQDNRVNRTSEYNNFSKYDDENDCSEYNHERNASFNSRNYKYDHTQRNYSDSYRPYGRQQSNSRGNQNPYEQCDSRYNEMPRRESSINRAMSRNYSSRKYSLERKGYRGRDYRYEDDNGRNINEGSFSRNNFTRERSIGRNIPDERNLKDDIDFTSDHVLSVESHAGRSFVIDTSVNRSFQELNVPTFDARRRRASSVGRSLISELTFESKSMNKKCDKHSLSSNSNNKFRRAQSVGREIAEPQEKKNFKDIKEELQSYKLKHDEKFNKSKNTNCNKIINTDVRKKVNERDPRISRRDDYDQWREKNDSRTTKTSTPRGHYRDPRMHREYHDYQKKYHDDTRGNSRGVKKHGIVYSTDNIAKGAILGSGYGVKNYKIPKIKKVLDEAVNKKLNENDKLSKNETVDESCTKNVKDDSEKINTLKQKQEIKGGKRSTRWNSNEKIMPEVEKHSVCSKIINKDLKNIENDMSITISENIEKRVTRSSLQNSLNETTELRSEENPKKKFNKIKEIEQDSDEESSENVYNITSAKENSLESNKIEIKIKEKPSDDKNSDILCKGSEKKIIGDAQLHNSHEEEIKYSGTNSNTLNSEESKVVVISNLEKDIQSKPVSEENNCFGEDLEMFTDNVATDPVIENINSLIADLDDDLDSKNDNTKKQFMQEISLENMLDNITCTNEKSADIREEGYVKENKPDLIQIKKINVEAEVSFNVVSVNDCVKSEDNHQTFNYNLNMESKSQLDVKSDENIHHSEVSTTDEQKSSVSTKEPSLQNEDHKEPCSTPDSTIEVIENNQDVKLQEGVPDSTNDLNCEMSSDITSTHIAHESKDTLELNTPQNNDKNDSIGSFLSILKDKSKIKELLTMLQDQSSENYKLKKKLEKLSEIVSDDEDELSANASVLESNISVCHDSNFSDNVKIDDLHEHTKLENIGKEEGSNSVDQNNDGKNIQNQKCESSFKEIEELKDRDEIDKEMKCTVYENESSENQNDSLCSQNDSIPIEKRTNKKTTTKNIKATRKNKALKGNSVDDQNYLTGAAAANTEKPVKKTSRELKQLQDDIKEMFMHDGFTKNNTGIRMCRLAKLIDDKSTIEKDEKNNTDSNPVVLLEKVKPSSDDITSKPKITRKKHSFKSKETQKEVLAAPSNDNENTTEPKIVIKLRPGPKSKTKVQERHSDSDPYIFESDSFSESNNTITGENKFENSSESENESLVSSNSYGSIEHLTEIKKKTKRKRPGWRAGVIKPKHKKKKIEMTHSELPSTAEHLNMLSDSILDENCFTDITYCFKKNVIAYSCRFCAYNGSDIVYHYKIQHPHSEIPLSRLSPDIAKVALEQCQGLDFQQLRKASSDKYVCRFCFKEISKKKNALEAFFWHVVSMHTGEYKQLCSECVNATKCPFNLDIPPTPKEPKGQLTGYVCCKCNYTQVSLENLKSHVINRHDNVETEVFEINLSVMTKKFLYSLKNSTMESAPRVLRSTRLNQSTDEISDEQNSLNETQTSDTIEFDLPQKLNIKEEKIPKGKRNKIQSKITFEQDEVANEISKIDGSTNVNSEPERQNCEKDTSAPDVVSNEACNDVGNVTDTNADCQSSSDDIFDYPHFKVHYTETGNKEYCCCINGVENHFRTPLLISFKKHVQIKHKDKWDGFCFVCKLIVTTQGNHYFKDCLEHFLDKHMDDFPILETVSVNQDEQTSNMEDNKLTSYLNVRPLSELITKSEPQSDESPLPVIESVVSLGAAGDETSHEALCEDVVEKNTQVEYKYEEAQVGVIGGKNNVVLGIMMSREKLVHIFKCAGRFCSYSTDNAEDALRHAVAHERVGGENSLDCAYCDFDSSKNAVDLVTHVFKFHGTCPFVCGFCFYRAAGSQLVRAHQLRLHENERTLIYRSTVTARATTSEKILPREIAVPFYNCNQDFGACQFKTYTSGKFAEHLQAKHQADSEFSCGVCQAKLARSSDLLQHMKIHGFRVYQCTWCIHGADSETELLAHASQKHPNKQPQSYLRIITNKEGSTGFRVLPLAQFNNSKVATIDVVPTGNKGNPEREAERSIDLEKLIGQTTQMMESIVTTGENALSAHSDAENVDGNLIGPMEMFDPEPLNQSRESLVMGLQSSLLNKIQEELSANASPLAVITPIPATAETPDLEKLLIDNNINKNQISLLKSEVKTPEKSYSDVIYCLDSDDENAGRNAIDVPAEDIPSTSEFGNKLNSVRVPPTSLFKCGLCRNTILKTAAGFKRHVSATHYQELDKLTCAHCSFIGERDAIVQHYVSEHSLVQDEIKRYVCGVCESKFITFSLVKKHLKEDHNLARLVVSSKQKNKGVYEFIVSEAPKATAAQQPVKRKLSGEKNDKKSPAMKIKKFGPHDIDSLPISPILDELVYCALCEFSSKVRLNMVRHLQLHAEQQPVPQSNPVNPVPHLETNEKHFDKMLNLASSSLASRVDKSNKMEQQPVVNPLIPPETISRFPKYVPDRQRYTCGAQDCCYTSVDENMFKYHWETLHSETNNYRCIHCPPHQHLNGPKISAARIIAHLKMHDIRLYACSSCPFYHNRRQTLEKHIADYHNSGHVMVIREESEVLPPVSTVSQPVNATPTMDLKPWQCGLCSFKSMLRPEVVDHCAKVHQSKMQYKCTYCGFRTSNMENITKHQSKSHAGRTPDTFYFYYREGSIPDEPDGTPRWQKQSHKSGLPETQVKTEAVENKELGRPSNSSKTVATTPPITIPVVDLKIIKKDPDAEPSEQSNPDLCETFGKFCEPNGLKYKCPLCEVVLEENKDVMQSHLYEELQYRKWACGFCSYKAFHKNGLNEHMNTEHRQYREPIELPVDSRVEMWITKALDHQFLLIEKTRQNMAKQPVVNPSAVPSTSKQDITAVQSGSGDQCTAENLQKLFGGFGEPDGMQFSCPKCDFKAREETLMRDHMEIELHKIRWCCNSCTQTFQNYHEAQFHCKSAHAGSAARAVGAVRDVGKRAAWVSALLLRQRLRMATSPAPAETTDTIQMPGHNSAPDNSLLVVRYEERIPTPELRIGNLIKRLSNDSDEDERRLVIDEPLKAAADVKQCIFCPFQCKAPKDFKEHLAQHTNIKPYFCLYCDLNGHRKTLLKHLNDAHKGQPVLLITKGQRALGGPLKVGTDQQQAATTSGSLIEDDKLICLGCEKSFNDNDAKNHLHDNVKPTFAKKGEVVVKCCVCLRLHQNIEAATAHHQACHPNESLNYAYYKLQSTKRTVYCCAYCEQQFSFWGDFKVHWQAIHSSLPLQFNKRNLSFRGTSESGSDISSMNLSDDEENLKRKSESPIEGPAPKMCARKSTSKLPVQSVAKKSTSKLPFTSEVVSNKGEYSYYGSKPASNDLDNVVTRMKFCNTDVSFTYKQLAEVINIDPIVLVKDL